jgi:hypothetical protein
MPMIVSDPELAASLAHTSIPQELRAPDGRLLGRYVPATPHMSFPEVGLTDDELLRRLAEPDGWVTANEVRERLATLRNNP